MKQKTSIFNWGLCRSWLKRCWPLWAVYLALLLFALQQSVPEASMRVWERGSGETISCGTGTCASTVAAVLNGYCSRGEEIEVQIRGGKLYDTYLESGEVLMKGPATTVFDGEIDVI